MDDDGEEIEEEFGPGDPDYDLSEQHGYRWEPPRDGDSGPIPRWVLVVVSLIIVVALLVPSLVYLLQYA